MGVLNRHDEEAGDVIYLKEDGFGGLVISMLATGTRVRGFKHG